MGFLDKFADKNITSLVKQYTGEHFIPEFRAPARSSISYEWDGWVALDSKSIWLVNKYGARGVKLSNVKLSDLSGQYPQSTRGYPLYIFTFHTLGGESFSVYPKTKIGGEELSHYLNRYMTGTAKLLPTNTTPGYVQESSEEALSRAFGASELNISKKPDEFKTCPMCAEQIRFAAKKCRYCQHLLS
jgi:hypothetical protein